LIKFKRWLATCFNVLLLAAKEKNDFGFEYVPFLPKCTSAHGRIYTWPLSTADKAQRLRQTLRRSSLCSFGILLLVCNF